MRLHPMHCEKIVRISQGLTSYRRRSPREHVSQMGSYGVAAATGPECIYSGGAITKWKTGFVRRGSADKAKLLMLRRKDPPE
jgi:hypothetical protein